MLITTIRKPPNQGNNCHLVRYKSQPVKNHDIQTKTHQSLDPLLETLRNSGRQSLSKVSGYEADATSWRDWSPDRTSWLFSIMLSLVQTGPRLRQRRSPGSRQSLISVSSLCSLRTIRANWEQIWAPGPGVSEDPIWGRWARGGAVKWTLPLSCDIGDTRDGHHWSAPGDFLRNFILMKSSSHPEQISKSAHYPRSPSNYINISSHQRFMSRVMIFPGWFLLFSTTTRISIKICVKTIRVWLITFKPSLRLFSIPCN